MLHVYFVPVRWLRRLVAGLSSRRAWFDSGASPYKFCGGQSGAGTGLLSSALFPITIIPHILHTVIRFNKRANTGQLETKQCTGIKHVLIIHTKIQLMHDTKPTKCPNFLLSYWYYSITFNTPICFSPQGTIEAIQHETKCTEWKI